MPAGSQSRQDQNDLNLIRNRNYIDPKRFYKKDDSKGKLPKYYQMGTVVAGVGETSMRRRERGVNITQDFFQ